MKIISEKEIFLYAVCKAARSVSQKSTIPILEGILINAVEDKIKLTGYDLDVGISCECEGKIIEEGSIVIQAKMLLDICRACNGEVISIVVKGTKIEITSGSVYYEIAAMDAADFPELPKPNTEPALKIKGDILKDMIEKTIFASSQDDKKPVNTGELFEIKKNKLTIVALDGYRLAICSREVLTTMEIDIIIPAKTMGEVSRLIGENIDEIEVSASRRFVVFSSPEFTLVSCLIEGDFLNYEGVIPKEEKTTVLVDVKDFSKCIERAALVINERIKNPLRITFDEDGIHIVCQTSLGRVTDDIKCSFNGVPMEVGFNNRYLQDALRAADCEKIKVQITNSLTAIKISPSESDNFLFLVLPIRFNQDISTKEE